jgi:hypothetical protein
VRFEGGKEVEGQVVYEGRDFVLVRRGSKETRFDAADVEWIDSAARRARAFVGGHDSLPPGKVEPVLELADTIEAEGLPNEAELLRLRVLALAPDNVAAHRALGHRREKDTWSWPDGVEQWNQEQLFERRREWGHAWELESTHYRVRSNVPLRETTGALLDLERFYHAFAREFPELELKEPWEKLVVHMYASSASFPEIGLERTATFDPESRTVHVLYTSPNARWSLLHEATHQILFSQAQRTPKARGEVPNWVEEGLAEYVAAAAQSELGDTFFHFGEPAPHHFREQASAKDPHGLERVLDFSYGDFVVSTDSSLKYAQAYSLVEYCLHGADGAYRAPFLGFVRQAFEGHSRKKDFLKALGIGKLRDFEKAWVAYVAEQARGA